MSTSRPPFEAHQATFEPEILDVVSFQHRVGAAIPSLSGTLNLSVAAAYRWRGGGPRSRMAVALVRVGRVLEVAQAIVIAWLRQRRPLE